MSTSNDIPDQSPSANTSSLPSIRELFGIRASDNLNSLISTPHRANRREAPPPSSYHHQALRSSSPHDARYDSRNSTRSYSFSSGEATHPYHGNQSSTTGRRAPSPMPRSGSYSASLLHPQATTTAAGNVGPAGGGFGPEPSASPTGFGRNGINERSVSAGGAGGLPPISTALPGFLPTNRGRAVSDTEAFTRSALTSSPTTSTTAPAGLGQSQQGVTPYTHAPPPLQQHPNHHHPSSLYQDQREYFGSSAATSTTTGNVTTNTAVARSRMGASDPLHPSLSTTITVATAGISSNNATTTTNSRQADNFTGQGSPLPDEAASAGGSHTPAWQRRSSIGTSRSSMDYPPSSSSSSVPVQEYEPHPFSSASLSARRSQGHYSSEGSTHASPTRSAPISGGFGSDRAPPSAYPASHHPPYRSSSRPRSANSSEGDEPTRSGYGRYECEYCSKRFNRPSSLRIHINTHTGAKPFQCPFPNCGRRFSVMSNMRRHARTHGTMMSSHSAEEDHTVSSSHYPTPGPGGTGNSNSIHHHHHHHHHHQGGADRDRGPMPSTSAPASSGPSSSSWSPPHHPHHAIERSASTRSVGALDQNQGYGSSRGGGVMERSTAAAAPGGPITGNGRHNHHNVWRGGGNGTGAGGNDRDPSGAEVDELMDDDDDEEMETDVGGGSSESDGYPPSSSRSPKGSASGHVSIHRPSLGFDGQDYVMRQTFGAG